MNHESLRMITYILLRVFPAAAVSFFPLPLHSISLRLLPFLCPTTIHCSTISFSPMSPSAKWVTDGMKAILQKHVVEYKDSTNRGTNDTRTKLIVKITQELQEHARASGETWNESSGEEVLIR